MAKVHVKVNDNVFVLNGKDAGKTGKVLKVDAKNNRVVVEGVNIITKHQKPNMRLNTGGLVKKEAAINASKVMLVCPKCKKPSKTGIRFLENGDKVRYCKACNAEIDTVRKAK
ncbi:MAG: 50S ribosomal protein L24 [Eubacteriales bacterium]|nr:50S ribosomal protein L24 [Eubacteriales bacterium]